MLAVPPEASLKTVKKAYRDLVKKWHPDQFGDDPVKRGEAEEKLKDINLSFERIRKALIPAPGVSTAPQPHRNTARRSARRSRATAGQKPNPRPEQRTSSAASSAHPPEARRSAPPSDSQPVKKTAQAAARKDLRGWQFGFAVAVVVTVGWLGLLFWEPQKKTVRPSRSSQPEMQRARGETLPNPVNPSARSIASTQPSIGQDSSASAAAKLERVISSAGTMPSGRPSLGRGSSPVPESSALLSDSKVGSLDPAPNPSRESVGSRTQTSDLGVAIEPIDLGENQPLITESLRNKIEALAPDPGNQLPTLEETAEADFQRGLDFANGRGVTRDYSEAERWYRSSAEAGHAEAQKSLGLLYATGRGVREDTTEAAKWLGRAASEGNSSASLVSGLLALSQEHQVKSTPAASISGAPVSRAATEGHSLLYKQLMNRGSGTVTNASSPAAELQTVLDPQAQFEKGLRYASGEGVEQSSTESAKWYRLAADAGHVEAQKRLGFLYATGKGVDQDYAEAEKWFRKAAENGAIGAALTKALRPAQVSDAEKLSAASEPDKYAVESRPDSGSKQK